MSVGTVLQERFYDEMDKAFESYIEASDYVEVSVDVCADCSERLTDNFAYLLDGELFCNECVKKEFYENY